ncbi:MFS transporter [Paenibacillus tyrfis]|uniref:MFS transporter n=1 Tax=Paenibacillus tyrfis TaxID=1501230 RepID=UPI000B594B60|nr:MFS transporter [Paenibacillus tyrfis]
MTPNVVVANIHDYFDRIAELVHGTVRTRSWEQQLSPPPHIGKGKITRMRIRPGMEIVVSDMTYERNMKLHIMEACRLFELSYCVSMFSFFFTLSYFLQYGLRYSVQSTSLVFLPIGAVFFLSSLVSSGIVRRWGGTVLEIGALVMAICSFALIGSLHADVADLLTMPNVVIPLVYGLGLGLAGTPLVNVALSEVPAKNAGTGSGLFMTFTNLANSLGVALIGILFSAVLGKQLAAAHLPDYIRAFSVSLTANGSLAFAAFICLYFLPKRRV